MEHFTSASWWLFHADHCCFTLCIRPPILVSGTSSSTSSAPFERELPQNTSKIIQNPRVVTVTTNFCDPDKNTWSFSLKAIKIYIFEEKIITSRKTQNILKFSDFLRSMIYNSGKWALKNARRLDSSYLDASKLDFQWFCYIIYQ